MGEGQLEPSGPIVIVVSLPEQRASVYRNGVRIGIATVSTGKRGHRTPTGVFTILNKDKDHHSKTYGNAPMPYSERLTWDGVALHAGGLPGYPSSHGCVHLPSEFARQLFEITEKGMTVVIADEATAPRHVAHPHALAPVDAASGETQPVAPLAGAQDFRWQPEQSPTGPVTVVISAADQRVLVLRNGIEIGRSRIALGNTNRSLGTHAYMAVEGEGRGPKRYVSYNDAAPLRWVAVSLPGHAGSGRWEHDTEPTQHFRMPEEFAAALDALLEPGVTMLVTDAP
ncbi:MAG: L,D-transpeptidase, partial [Candidatus Competibacteraceae bacterium]|nr:L,D-transpeptidase [Candidatus Competibacteraceae bacterium]